MCIFEYIYFARPDSVIAGQSVHEARVNAGRLLARRHPVEADLVVGVPDSGLDAARGYAQESGIPYGVGFGEKPLRGPHFHHSRPDQPGAGGAHQAGLPCAAEVEGRRVVMIDDSIVRGTTCRQITNLLREAGAKEVHIRASAPPFIAPCYFGTDIPDRERLIACQHSLEEIREIAGADSLGYPALWRTCTSWPPRRPAASVTAASLSAIRWTWSEKRARAPAVFCGRAGLFFFGGFLLTRSSACHLSWGCGFLVGSRELMRKATVTPTTVSDTRAAA